MREKVDLRDNTAMPHLISEGHGNKLAQSGFGKGYLLPPSYQSAQEEFWQLRKMIIKYWDKRNSCQKDKQTM